jgi:GTP pyrophosphokinase
MSETPKTKSAEEIMIQEEFDNLIADYLNTNHRRKVELITKAFNLANQAHQGAKRRSGEPYIMHPLAVARIVCKEIGLGSTSICCALLHDVVEDTEYTVEDMENMFSPKIAQIVDGLTKISGGIFGEKASAQAENFRKLLLTMSDDIRVVLIKIADRLHNMRTLGSMLPAKQYKIAGETLYLYAPMAHRLGLFSIKTELEDLSFKYEHPEEYASIKAKLRSTEQARRDIYKRFSTPVIDKLNDKNLKYEMLDRVKSVYSIWSKMQAKGVGFEEIYDIFAVRIIFESSTEINDKNICWEIYSIITDIYGIKPDRIRDWVSRPKANGYQALHVTVMGPDGQWVEIQIRSRRMDDIAEKGFAAHWKYKEHNVEEDTELDKWLHTITEILESPDPNALDFLDTIKLNLFTSEIFVFTPKGDIKTLPQSATALDFAYALHTNIGNRCIGAKVNHRLVPLSHTLKSGDQVEILTSKSQIPQPEWSGYVTTAKAKAKVDAALRRYRKDLVKVGEAKVNEVLLHSELEVAVANYDKLALYYGFQKRDEFLFAVAKQDLILPDNVKKMLKEKTDNALFKYVKQAFRVGQKTTMSELPVLEKGTFDKKRIYLLKEDSYERNYKIAECCKPIPGDDAFGFINENGEVIVHKRSCPIGVRLKSSFGERILTTEWSNHKHSSFEAILEIKGIDSVGVLNDITRAISGDFAVNIQRLVIDANDGMFEGKIKMLVHDVEDVQKMCVALSKIQNVKSVGRVAN